MTVMIAEFFGLPHGVVRLGHIGKLSPVALDLLVGLWYESEHKCTRELTFTVAELQALVGGSRTSHTKARTELITAGLVIAAPCGPDGFMFSLCNPETRLPWPLPPKVRVRYVRKGRNAEGVKASPTYPSADRAASSKNGDATKHSHGFNNSQHSTTIPSHQPVNPLPKWDEFNR